MRALLVAAVLLAAPVALAATTTPATLRLADRLPPTLDPALAGTPDAVLLQNALCDRLYAAGHNGTISSQIATALPVAGPSRQRPKQWTTYTIKLSPKYRFQDGTRVTAYNFAQTFTRDANPDEASPALAELKDVVGVAAVAASEASTVSGVVANDDTTLEITTMRHVPGLAAMLAQAYFCPVEEETPVAPAGLAIPPSAGPFYVQSNGETQIVLARNPHYGGKRRPKFARIVLRTGVAIDACQTDVHRGAVDLCLDALPQRAGTFDLSSLVGQGWLSAKVGCLSWAPVVRVDLIAACPR